jgi:hypothetical protein
LSARLREKESEDAEAPQCAAVIDHAQTRLEDVVASTMRLL